MISARPGRGPLGSYAFGLVGAETALLIALYAPGISGHPIRFFMLAAMGIALLVYAGVMAYVHIKLVNENPHLLHNPSDYTPAVQKRLFDGTPKIAVSNPSVSQQKP